MLRVSLLVTVLSLAPAQAAAREFLPGDGNGDGSVDVADAVTILLHLFAGGTAPASPAALDSDGSGAVYVTDAVYLLEHLFRGGPPPVAPPPVRMALAWDNAPGPPYLQADWGFSAWIGTGDEQVLVDAGPSGPLVLESLAALGIDPLGIDRLVFTHTHRDHIGGTEDVLARVRDVPVHIPASFPDAFRQVVAQAGCTVVDVSGPAEVGPRVRSSGELDGSPREQCLFVDSPRGTVVVVGCAHPGIVEVVEEALRQRGPEVFLVFGGFHLFQSEDAAVGEVVRRFRELGVRKVAPCHCTGARARELFREEYGEDFLEVGLGSRISVP